MGAAIPRRTLTCASRVRGRVETLHSERTPTYPCRAVLERMTTPPSSAHVPSLFGLLRLIHGSVSRSQRGLFCCGQYYEVKTRTSVIVRVIKTFGVCPTSRNRALEWFDRRMIGRLIGRLICSMDCVVSLCFPPVRAELFVWICAFAPTTPSTGHAIPWLQRKSCITLSSAQKPRFRVNTRTLLETSAARELWTW